MARQFAVTFDYRCPFARNGHESVVAGLRDGPRLGRHASCRSRSTRCTSRRASRPVWERDPAEWGTGVLALLWGIAVRDAFPDHFLDWHIAAFAARHDDGAKIAKAEVLARDRDVGRSRRRRRRGRGRVGPAAQDARRRAHRSRSSAGTCSASRRSSSASRPCSCASWTAGTPDDIDRVLDLLEWTDLNEFKHTSVPR